MWKNTACRVTRTIRSKQESILRNRAMGWGLHKKQQNEKNSHTQ